MGANPTKAASNIYCKCRKQAAIYNDKLASREGAAELLGISVSTLADYELGITKNIPPENVIRMADLYSAPELENNYCSTECPIGCRNVPKLEVQELDRVVLKMLHALRKNENIKDELIDIAADGVIEENEKERLNEIINTLDTLLRSAQELKLWNDKNIERG